MVKNQDKEKAYIMAQGPSAITSLGEKTPAIRIILFMIRIRMDNYKSNGIRIILLEKNTYK